MAVTDHAPSAVLEPRLHEGGDKRVGLRGQRLGQDAPRALARERRQRIIDFTALAERQDAGSLGYGVSLPMEVLAGLNTRHDTPPSQTVITQVGP